MPAYVIADIDVHGPEPYRGVHGARPREARAVRRTLPGPRRRARAIRGDWRPRRLVMVEFPSADHAGRWYASEDYVAAMAIRDRASTGNVVLVEGPA
jgi:uncharacterized protein (DUF1330 family)